MKALTKKIIPLTDYISASEAAQLLSDKLGRPVRPDYVRKLKNVRSHMVNAHCRLYHRDDILACTVKQKLVKKDKISI